MGKVRCVFCNVTRKRAKEHVWPRWLLECFDEANEVRAETHRTFTGDVISRRIQSRGSLVLGTVCELCNGGWMSRLEAKSAAIIRPLLQLPAVSSGGNLSADEARVLALWAFKTAIVRNLGTNYRRIVPSSHFRHLHDHLSIPEGVFVDLAVSPTHRVLKALQSQAILGVVRKEDEANFAKVAGTIYNVVLAIGPLFVRVIHLPMRGYTLVPGVGHDPPCSVRLHPSQDDEVSLGTGVFTGALWDFESDAHFRAAGT